MAEPTACSLIYYKKIPEKARGHFSSMRDHLPRLNKKCYKFSVSLYREFLPGDLKKGVNEGIIQTLLNFKKKSVPLIITPVNPRTRRMLIKNGITDENIFCESSKIFLENGLVKFRLIQDERIKWNVLDEEISDHDLGIDFKKPLRIEISSYINADAITSKLLPAKDTSEKKRIKDAKIRYKKHYLQNVGANLTDYRNKIQEVRENNYQSFDFTTLPDVSYENVIKGELPRNKTNTMMGKKAYENMIT